MPRLLFEKTGDAVWISHLDLMRLFQRAFKRSGLLLTHTQGFNPRPSVSIAMPLSVGIESVCEILDFDLDIPVAYDIICEKLNGNLVNGIRVLKVYDDGMKIRDLAFLSCVLTMEYDAGLPEGIIDALKELFSRDELMVEKKSKSGPVMQNIKPMIRSLQVSQADEACVQIDARICCQNPSLNPMQLQQAVCTYLPEFSPEHVLCRRTEIYTNNGELFR